VRGFTIEALTHRPAPSLHSGCYIPEYFHGQASRREFRKINCRNPAAGFAWGGVSTVSLYGVAE
jgi:Ni/Co efflux regulator RcnB